MKYLLLFGLIYMIYKYSTLKSHLSSQGSNERSKINKNDQKDKNEGEYIDYEEVD